MVFESKVFFFPPKLEFLVQNSFMKVLFPDCTLTWRVNNFVSPEEEVYLGEMKIRMEDINCICAIEQQLFFSKN